MDELIGVSADIRLSSEEVYTGDMALGNDSLTRSQYAVCRRRSRLDEHVPSVLQAPPDGFNLTEYLCCRTSVLYSVFRGS